MAGVAANGTGGGIQGLGVGPRGEAPGLGKEKFLGVEEVDGCGVGWGLVNLDILTSGRTPPKYTQPVLLTDTTGDLHSGQLGVLTTGPWCPQFWHRNGTAPSLAP